MALPAIRRRLSPESLRSELARDVRAGLSTRPKSLPPKYFYDGRGSELFDEITRLPEYYLTRAETQILETRASEIMGELYAQELVEIGSGSSRKTCLLLEALHEHGGTRYAPIDVSEDALRDAAARLQARYPWLEFQGTVGDFERDLEHVSRTGRRLIAFLGSTIGNLERDERVPFFRRVRAELASGDAFLLGLDLVKDARVLHAAYNDSRGVTAAFNKNVLRVVNRELEGDLDEDAFEHIAFYDEESTRIEMHLESRRSQRARIAALDLEVDFEAGERMRTEISCKFVRSEVEQAFASAGLVLERWMTDAGGAFALALARPAAHI